MYERIVKDIKNKKTLSGINDSIVEKELDKLFLTEPKLRSRIDSPRSKNYKSIIKKVREKLHKTYGMFQLNTDRDKLLQKLNKNNVKEICSEVLKTHLSTKERLPYYSELYSDIFKITKKPKSILDLGCGLNPFSIPWMGLKNIKYIATDISKEDLNFINKFFKIIKIDGKVKELDLVKIKKENVLKQFPKVNICFLFKVFESIELTKGHKLSELIIINVKANFVIVSFPTKTLLNKPMKMTKRPWLERMLKRLNYNYEIYETGNEIYYIVTKH